VFDGAVGYKDAEVGRMEMFFFNLALMKGNYMKVCVFNVVWQLVSQPGS